MIVQIKSSHEEETTPLATIDFDGVAFGIPGYFVWTVGDIKYGCCYRERVYKNNVTILIFYAYLV